MTDTNQTFTGRVSLLKHLLYGSKRFFGAGIALGWLMSLFSMISPRVITYTVDTVLGQEPPDLPGPVLAWVDGLGGTAFFREHLYYVALAVVLMTVFMLSVLAIRYAMLVCVRWTVEDEMLCRTSGVLSRNTDYIELYRIVDYQESRTLMQRLLGVKTVTVYSTDKSDAVSDILGVPAGMDLVGMLREKVEECKRERNIYEIANR